MWSNPGFIVITEILGTSTLPEPSKQENTVIWYPWTISNKYYTAGVSLCVVPSTFQMCSEVAQSMQAFIVYFNSTVVSVLFIFHFLVVNRKLHHTHNANSFWSPGILQKDGLSSVSSWLPIVEDLAPEVLILACDHVCDDGECPICTY